MGEIYEYIDTWDGKRVFTYVVIFMIIYWFITKKELGINTLVAIIIGTFVINYLNYKTIQNEDTSEKIQDIKKKAIIPKLSDESNEQKHIVDFLFSIQDLYPYNPQNYEDIIHNINYFYALYKLSFVDNKSSQLNYEMMKRYKCDALNALMSIIYSLPEDKRLRDKINTSASVLDGLMTKNLDQISYLTDNYIYKNGYNIETKIIDYGPKASNDYDDLFKIYSYEIY